MRTFSHMGKLYDQDARAARARRRASLRKDREVTSVPKSPVKKAEVIQRIFSPVKNDKKSTELTNNANGINWPAITEIFGSCVHPQLVSPCSRKVRRGAGIFACASSSTSTPTSNVVKKNNMLDLIATP